MTAGTDPVRMAILSSASAGGAGLAARRLADALELTAAAGGPDIAPVLIDIGRMGEAMPDDVAPRDNLSNRRVSDTHFTLERPGFCRGWLVELLSGYDVVNVHWASYLISLAELDALSRRGTPMVFMLHDFHYLTGGCHYPAGCAGLEEGCHACPQLDRERGELATVARAFAVKRAILARPNVHLMTPSRFLRDCAVRAGAIPAERAHVLRNPYAPDHGIRPGLTPDGPARILLIADSLVERRKNTALALDAIARLAADSAAPEVEVDVVGLADEALQARLAAAGVRHVLHGHVADHARLGTILARADVVLTCSNEDNWPNVLVEAGCYGAAAVVGPGHGCAEFVQAYACGAIAEAYTPEAFARALKAGLEISPGMREAAAAAVRADHHPARIASGFETILQAMGPVPGRRGVPEEIPA